MKNYTTDYLQWIEKCAAALYSSGHFGQAINYRKAGRSFARFLKDTARPLPAIRDVTPPLVMEYNLWLETTGIVRNSISFYNRQLRATYNRAVRRGHVRDIHPFREAYTGVSRTRKRAIPVRDISRLCSVVDKSTAMARDLFEFSFATCGMSFVDMAYLRKGDVRSDTLNYRRRKTGAEVIVPLSDKANAIIRKYASLTSGSQYVFPIIGDATGEDAYRKYCSALSSYNRALRMIGRKTGIPRNLTSYVARHTWATAARDIGAPVSVISAALGHSSERTTQIYLGCLDTSKILEINRKIMRRTYMTNLSGYCEEPDNMRVQFG